MKKLILIILCLAVSVLTAEISLGASCGAAVSPMPLQQPISPKINYMRMNTMSPANYKYPASYAHHVTSSSLIYNGFVPSVTSRVGGPNVNIYVGYPPVYIMRSGMVKVRRCPKKSRTNSCRYDDDCYCEEY